MDYSLLSEGKQVERIRDTSLRVQFAGTPSTNKVLEASGGSDGSGRPPYPTLRLSNPPTPSIRLSSTG